MKKEKYSSLMLYRRKGKVMEQNLLVGNGINIQFGGADIYSSSSQCRDYF